jgi:predicted nucleic acid-binding protein
MYARQEIMGKVFVDTNIIVYAREKDDIKKNAIKAFLD